jgi:hypothetical protein
LIISESGITASSGKKGYMGVTGNAIWERDAFRIFFAQMVGTITVLRGKVK